MAMKMNGNNNALYILSGAIIGTCLGLGVVYKDIYLLFISLLVIIITIIFVKYKMK